MTTTSAKKKATPTVAERKAQLLRELRAIEEQEQAEARAEAARAGQRAAVAAVALAQLQPRFEEQARALAALEQQMNAARALIGAPARPQKQKEGAQSAGRGTPNVAYKFWLSYGRQYRTSGVTQRALSAACRAAGVDQQDTSRENLARAHAAVTEKRKQPDYQPSEKQRKYQQAYYQRRKAARKQQPASEAAEQD